MSVCIDVSGRYKLPIVFVVMNNSGIYRGVDSETWDQLNEEPDLSLRCVCVCVCV